MPTIHVSDADNSQTFTVQTGDQIVVRLEESPTTGYRWAIESLDQAVVAPQATDFASSGSGIGGGGERIMTFNALKAGTTKLALKLWRDWEGDTSVIKRFEATINVQ